MPVSWAEIGIDGMTADALPEQFDSGCRDDLVAMDGTPIAARVRGYLESGFTDDIELAYAFAVSVPRTIHQASTEIRAVDEGDVVGFGKPAPGRSYPAVYTSSKINGVRGIFRQIS